MTLPVAQHRPADRSALPVAGLVVAAWAVLPPYAGPSLVLDPTVEVIDHVLPDSGRAGGVRDRARLPPPSHRRSAVRGRSAGGPRRVLDDGDACAAARAGSSGRGLVGRGHLALATRPRGHGPRRGLGCTPGQRSPPQSRRRHDGAASPEHESLLTPGQVATMFNVNPKTVTRWADSGQRPRSGRWVSPPLPRVRDPGASRHAAIRTGRPGRSPLTPPPALIMELLPTR